MEVPSNDDVDGQSASIVFKKRLCAYVPSLLKHDRVGRVGRIVRMLHRRLIVTSGQVRRNRVNKMVFEIRFNGLGALTTS